jgi:NhaA family Na+:H+ antiporter
MSIFIDELAFKGSVFLGAGKLAILVATAVAAVLALVLGRLLLPRTLSPDVAAVSAAEAEASTEY